MNFKSPIYICFFLLAFNFYGKAQNHFQLKIINTDSSSFFKNITVKQSYTSFLSIQQELKNITAALQQNGFLLTSIDSVHQDSVNNKVSAYLSIGNKYKWGYLKPAKNSERIFAETGFRERFYSGTPFSPKELNKILTKILSYCENNGYPFASVKLDSVQINTESLSAQIIIEKHKYIQLDSIIILGDALIKKSFLHHYFQIKEGSAYNEENLKSISSKVRQIPFLKETKPQLVRITDKYTKLYLFLDKKNASQFDGILGLLPDAKGKTIITGDLRIKLQNLVFKAGELFDINWRRLQSQTQDLKLRLAYPYLFNTPIGTDYTLKIYRRDTSFIDIQNNLGLQYIFKGLNYLKVFYKQRNANLLSTSGLETLSTLPDYADILTASYGIGGNYENLDYKFNPRKGIYFNINTSAGNRQIKKNGRLNPKIYNNVQLNAVQYQAEGELNFFIPLLKHSTVKLGLQGGTIYSQQVFKNELFRIGGLKTLRGFDEESLFSSSFGIGTLEYRFLFEQNSAIYLFSDACWYENNSINTYITDLPYSIGAGISFETKAGIFSLNYALGKQFNNSIDLRSGKIHFGIVNNF